ncbi:MAG: hypothetical protein QOD39_2369 [Mycobacterium sp.]|nr:hypothetical protein [Mycobacterium sp.]
MQPWQPADNNPQPYPPAYGPPAYGPPAYGPTGYGWSPPPQGPAGVWPVLLWGLAVVSLIGALVCGAIAYAGFYSNDYLDDYGVRTTATVTDLEPFTETVTVEFTTDDGAPVTAEIVWFTADAPDVGDEIEITYDPADPSYATEAGSDSDAVMGVIYAVVAVFALAVMVGAIIGAVLVHRRRGKAKRQRATW